jgi:hypothetical protein
MKQHVDPLPRDVQPPGPPPELRERVLTAARAAAATDQGAGLWHRLWTSRPLRLAWAAAVVGLIIGHSLIGPNGPKAPPAGPALPVAAAAGNAGELAEVAALGRLTAELPGWEIAVAPHRGTTAERTSS